MDYYKEKKKAQTDIFNIIASSQESDFNKIVFVITQRYGFGAKLVKEYIKLLAVQGFITYDQETGKVFNLEYKPNKVEA